jgi:polyphosphate kinase
LKARFDAENNIEWARMVAAGIHVVYSQVNRNTRQGGAGRAARRQAYTLRHLGTANASTARTTKITPPDLPA